MELHMIAIIPRAGTRDHVLDRWIFDPANAPQLIAQNLPLCFQLFFIGQILIMTSTTYPEMFAARKNSMWRGVENFHQFSACKASFFLRPSNTHALTWQAKWNKNGTPIFKAPYCVAAIG